jgi:hypothetical protein
MGATNSTLALTEPATANPENSALWLDENK